LLENQAYDRWTTYKAHECKALEIYTFEGVDTTPRDPVVISDAHLHDWIHQEGAFSLPHHGPEHPFLGGLRILVQEWDDSTYATKMVIPFKDLFTFQDVISALDLSPDYAYLFRHSEYIAPRVTTMTDKVSNATITSTIFQSPTFSDSFTTLSLSYNSQTRMTSGLLGYIKNNKNKDLLSSILLSKDDARHPLLLPLMCFNNSLRILRRETQWRTLERIEIATLIDRAVETSYLDTVDFPGLHKRLIDVHLELTSSMGQFIEQSGASLTAILQPERIMEMLSPESSSDTYFTEKNANLMRCMRLIDATAKDSIHLRERISARTAVLMKVLYNHMQQRDSEINRDLAKQSTQMAIESTAIAEATQRDSSSMKAVAVLTMVFLPSTAVSTIFSMSVFFNVASDSTIIVNSSFWLYWAITLPLTLAVLATWALWLYSDDLKRVYHRTWSPEIRQKTTSKILVKSSATLSSVSPSDSGSTSP